VVLCSRDWWYCALKSDMYCALKSDMYCALKSDIVFKGLVIGALKSDMYMCSEK
jgi:hypothetical protein